MIAVHLADESTVRMPAYGRPATCPLPLPPFFDAQGRRLARQWSRAFGIGRPSATEWADLESRCLLIDGARSRAGHAGGLRPAITR